MSSAAPSAPNKLLATVINFIRGGLIGAVEIVPGVSGGTVALIVGLYETLIDGAGHIVRGSVYLVKDGLSGKGLARTREQYSSVKWGVIVPVIVGMAVALVVAAALIAPFVDDNPEVARGLFAGLILMSLVVPARMVGGRWHAREVVWALIAAIIAVLITSIPTADPIDPPLYLVAIAAAVAVCALVLPGVSGSFILVVAGMYAPTLAALNDRNFAYLGVFILGAIIGLGLFVSGLQWLLTHKHRMTLAVMTGLMVGSLRALWPWQTDDGGLEPVGDHLLPVIVAFVIGIVAVAALLVIESRLVRNRTAEGDDVLHPESHPN